MGGQHLLWPRIPPPRRRHAIVHSGDCDLRRTAGFGWQRRQWATTSAKCVLRQASSPARCIVRRRWYVLGRQPSLIAIRKPYWRRVMYSSLSALLCTVRMRRPSVKKVCWSSSSQRLCFFIVVRVIPYWCFTIRVLVASPLCFTICAAVSIHGDLWPYVATRPPPPPPQKNRLG